MSGGNPGRWRFAVLAIMPLFAVLPILVRDRALIVEMWPTWRGMIENLVLLVAIVAGLAAVVSGVVTWRKNHA